MTGPMKVLVVEDSLTIRKHIVELLEADPRFVVVGEAADGKVAIERCQSLRPDVITMDMMLPVMTGLAATEYIMAYCPTPILIVSASLNRGELFRTYEALAAGAVDVLEKPSDEPDADWGRRLCDAVALVARIRVITHPRARLTPRGQLPQPAGSLPPRRDARLVAIGASTGGPGALRTLLQALPADFALPILLVLHIAEPFGAAMAEWLDAQTPIAVRYAVDGEPLPPVGRPCVLMAPPDRHLEVTDRGRLRLHDGPERHSCRPSVDVLFESLARHLAGGTIACLLTGMGRDGAQGLLAIRQQGGLTLAQDELTSVVFGMPGEAAKIGAAARVLPIEGMAGAIAAAAKEVET